MGTVIDSSLIMLSNNGHETLIGSCLVVGGRGI